MGSDRVRRRRECYSGDMDDGDMNQSADAANVSSSFDPVIEAYKKDVDRTLLRENLKLTPEQRVRRLIRFLKLLGELRRAGRGLS